MALVFSAFIPHPPQALPTVGGDATQKLEKTVSSLKQLEQDLYASRPDILMVISPHGQVLPEAVTVHFTERFFTDFQQFGDLKTKLAFTGDLGLAYLLRERCETSFPLHATAESHLDYGVSVPLFFLAQRLRGIRLIVLHPGLLPPAQHFLFGQKIQGQLKETNARVAVVASGDLSHRHTATAPGGFAAEAKPFDEKIVASLKYHRLKEILEFPEELRKQAGECGLGPLAILLGIIEGMQYNAEILSYEAPIGIGYLTVQFRLS